MVVSWELVAFLLIVAIAAGLVIRGLGSLLDRFLIVLAVLTGATLYITLVWSPGEPTLAKRLSPPESQALGYVSSKACRACHPQNYDTWHASYHRTMTQVASRDTVIAPWEPVEVSGRGRTMRIDIRDGQLWADDVDGMALGEYLTRNPGTLPPKNLLRRSGPVVMTTGSHHMQIYWFRGKEGLFHQLNWVWLKDDERWVPAEDVYSQPPHGNTGIAPGFWNTNCIHCHSTGPEPRLVRAGSRSTADTRVGELGISCEACHGPADKHIQKHQNPLSRYWHRFTGADDVTIVNPLKLSKKRATEVCGQCHGLGRTVTHDNQPDDVGYRPGDNLDVYKHMASPMQIHDKKQLSMYYWPDGTTRVTGREYNALQESRCFLDGEMTCMSCHTMHKLQSDPRSLSEWTDDQLTLGMDGNKACIQCHAEQASKIEKHTHHAPSSVGSDCYNCHMPNTTNGLLKMTRSHTIDSPTARSMNEGSRPNACNLCHLDRTLKWTQERLEEWYGQSSSPLTEEEKSIPASVLWLVQGDAIQRAAAAWHFGWSPAQTASGQDWQAAWLARTLDDPYAAVRYISGRSLVSLPGYEDFRYDYLSGPDGQDEAVRRALKWSPQSVNIQPADAELFEILRAQRNNTPITVVE